jgi:hypothetical protein
MKKLSKEQLIEKFNSASLKTGYVYTFTGFEKQTDKIKVFCKTHNYYQEQTREYATQGRKIACCNKFAPMINSDFKNIISKF